MLQQMTAADAYQGAGRIEEAEHGRLAYDLVANARAALARNPDMTLEYLRRLEDLLAPRREEASAPTDPSGRPGNKIVRGGLVAWQIRLVVRHIDAHLGRSIRLDELAAVARLSSSHFSRAFKIAMEEAPHRFIMRRRIEHAQELMLTTGDTLSQIACDCGLTDQAHLTRLFRRFVGDTPLNWRRMRRKAA